MEIKLFRKKVFQIKIVDINQKGFMRQNCQEISVRIYAGKLCTNFSKYSLHTHTSSYISQVATARPSGRAAEINLTSK